MNENKPRDLPINTLLPEAMREFVVACLCAEWCGTCRDYRPEFQALQSGFPNIEFRWIDVEENASWAEDFEVEDFPTILIQRSEWVLFYGTMLPHQSHLRRMIEVLHEQTREQSREYAYGNDERRAWQERYKLPDTGTTD
ncbi:MAG: thioredoxin family protein [Pseudomonadota bacterium]